MKRCPKCNDLALYSDEILACPICDTALVKYVRQGTSSGHPQSKTSNAVKTSSTPEYQWIVNTKRRKGKGVLLFLLLIAFILFLVFLFLNS